MAHFMEALFASSSDTTPSVSETDSEDLKPFDIPESIDRVVPNMLLTGTAVGTDDESAPEVTDTNRIVGEIHAKLRVILLDNEKLAHDYRMVYAENRKLALELRNLKTMHEAMVQKFILSNEKMKDYEDMKQRCQKDHDYHAVVAPFCAWYTKNFPSFEDSVDSCQGACARSALDTDVKIVKYSCNSSSCTPLLLCQDCYASHPKCVRCNCMLRDPNGWSKKRRLPMSWENRP